MTGPQPPRHEDADAEPDPEDVTQLWEVAACKTCGRTIWRRARRRGRTPGGWRHLYGGAWSGEAP